MELVAKIILYNYCSFVIPNLLLISNIKIYIIAFLLLMLL